VVYLGNKGSRGLVLGVLGDGAPRGIREVSVASGLGLRNVMNALFLCWKAGLVLRSEKPVYERERARIR
jgi:hypothetical protein